MKRVVTLFSILILLFGSCSQKRDLIPVFSDEDFSQIDGLILDWVQKEKIVGAEFLVMQSGETLFHEAYGWRDRERELPMVRNTICRIRSMTKPIVGTSVLMLADEEKIKLRDKVSKYIPSFNTEVWQSLTIHHLLHHNGGFGRLGYPGWATSYNSLEEIVQAAAKAGPASPPGETFSYTDAGSSILAYIVSKVSGMPVETFIDRRILEPLDMNDAFCFLSPDEPRRSRISCTYRKPEDENQWVKYWDNHDPPQVPYFRGSGGIYASAMDYARFLTMWINYGNLGNRKFLNAETVGNALIPSELSIAADSPYGHHWFVYKNSAFGHGGSDGTFAMAVPEHELIVCYFTQSRGNRTMRKVLNWVLEGIDSNCP